MQADDVGREFSDASFRRSKAVRFGLVIVLLAFLLGSMSGSTVTGAVTVYMGLLGALIAFLGVGLLRSQLVGIHLTAEAVELRTTYSTRRLKWDTIVRARVHERSVRQRPYLASAGLRRDQRTSVYPMFDLVNGRDARIYGLQMVARELDDSDWIEEAVRAVNRVVAARRGDPEPARPR